MDLARFCDSLLVTSLEQRVLKNVRQSRMLAPGDRVGVAVSGGADSVALLRLIENLRDRLGITLLVVHFDHRLRGAESDADAQFVQELARSLDLEFILGGEDVAVVAAKLKWNLEDAARRCRYAFFARLVEQGRVNRIVVAHTEDDQAETVLAHLLRGTGLTGLGGIHPAAGPIVRPLLSERRQDLREYLRTLGQSWRVDSSNRDVNRTRARIREQLLPLLERSFSKHTVSHLAGLSALAREEESFWTALVEDRFRAFVHAKDGRLGIRISDLLAPIHLSHPVASPEAQAAETLRALTERLVRRLYQGVHGNRQGLTAAHVQQVIHLVSESSSGRRIELPGGVLVERDFGDVVFSQAQPATRASKLKKASSRPNAYSYVVSLEADGETTVCVPEVKRRFHLKVIDWSSMERDTKRETQTLDADRLRGSLVLRNWRPGDAYRPRGRSQARKLKDMFLAGRVPSRDRACWPVLESGGRIAWARGMPAADEFCAREGTRAGVVIEEDSL
jgi:tRNA(Ile)-lysidine synthase